MEYPVLVGGDRFVVEAYGQSYVFEVEVLGRDNWNYSIFLTRRDTADFGLTTQMVLVKETAEEPANSR